MQKLVDDTINTNLSGNPIKTPVANLGTDAKLQAALGPTTAAALTPRLQAVETKAANAMRILKYAGYAAPQQGRRRG